MAVQLLFHIRKKLPSSPLGKAATWLKVHVYLGYVVAAIFLIHTSFSWPETWFESALWTLFVIVVLFLIGAGWASYIGKTLPIVFDDTYTEGNIVKEKGHPKNIKINAIGVMISKLLTPKRLTRRG